MIDTQPAVTNGKRRSPTRVPDTTYLLVHYGYKLMKIGVSNRVHRRTGEFEKNGWHVIGWWRFDSAGIARALETRVIQEWSVFPRPTRFPSGMEGTGGHTETVRYPNAYTYSTDIGTGMIEDILREWRVTNVRRMDDAIAKSRAYIETLSDKWSIFEYEDMSPTEIHDLDGRRTVQLWFECNYRRGDHNAHPLGWRMTKINSFMSFAERCENGRVRGPVLVRRTDLEKSEKEQFNEVVAGL